MKTVDEYNSVAEYIEATKHRLAKELRKDVEQISDHPMSNDIFSQAMLKAAQAALNKKKPRGRNGLKDKEMQP